ncbi:MAG: hypothetical protein U5J64_09340 [Halobacteriales archaeon]|nr:hypothetical protein [Halobacteriales archaeon]
MVTPRQATLVALLALVPTAGYAFWSPESTPYLAVVNTVLITAAVYFMLSPAEGNENAVPA